MARIKQLILLLTAALALPLLALLAQTAHAAPEEQRQAVYNAEVFDGQGYSAQFYPENVQTIYVLADAQNVFVPKITNVYWWPITHEYKADWESANEPLTGTLEIGNLKFSMTPYSLRYNGGYDSAKTGLLVGDAAAQGYSAYQKAQSDYQAAAGKYSDDWNTFQAQLEQWGQLSDALRAQGLPTSGLKTPQQPVPPQQITVTVTAPQQGIPFSLPAGEYKMLLRGTDGKVVAGSERTIVAFTPRRDGIAYKVIAASKWTLPDASTDPSDMIFVSGEKALYIQPASESEYDAYYAAELLNPQQRATQDRRGIWSWLPTGKFSGSALSVTANGATQTVRKATYYVKQLPGAVLGYDILPYDASAGEGVSTFEAFKLQPQTGAMTISSPGTPGSSREVRTVNTGMGGVVLGLAFAPLMGGLLWLSYRRWKTR